MKDGQGRISRKKPFRVYEGSWHEDKFNGLGVIREGTLEYRGDFANGKKVKNIFFSQFFQKNFNFLVEWKRNAF